MSKGDGVKYIANNVLPKRLGEEDSYKQNDLHNKAILENNPNI